VILHRGLLEVVHEDFDTCMPGAANRQAHGIDAPGRLVDAAGVEAQRLNPCLGLGQDEDDFFRRQRPKLAVEQAGS
jgi:hypothetical protein